MNDPPIEQEFTNIKDRFYTTIEILSIFIPTFLMNNLNEAGQFILNTTSVSFLSLILVLLSGISITIFLNKKIDVAEAFIFLALFMLSVALTAYVYGNGYASKTENPKDFVINAISICFSFIGSILQVVTMLYESIKRRRQRNKVSQEESE